HLLSKPLEARMPRVAVGLAVLWPALWTVAVAPLILVEAAYAAIARAPKLELGRIRDAMYSGFGMAGVLIFAFAVVYAASERDKKFDLSYFRTAKPGEATRKVVRTLGQATQVALFFPPANDVGEQVSAYFDDLRGESKLLEVS